MSSLQKTARLAGLLARVILRNPRRLPHVLGTALAAAEEVADPALDLMRFRVVSVDELLPEKSMEEQAVVALFPKGYASQSALESFCLVLLLKKAKARNVFEFGTYKGISITQLALNLPADAGIYTLDLPEEPATLKYAVPDPFELEIAREKGKGSLVPAALKSRIQFVQQDSAALDVKPYAGRMDFVFVDGAHSAGYVRNDSEKGWAMLRSGGIIAWHDCRLPDPAVVEFLLQCPYQPARIAGTSLAFALKP